MSEARQQCRRETRSNALSLSFSLWLHCPTLMEHFRSKVKQTVPPRTCESNEAQFVAIQSIHWRHYLTLQRQFVQSVTLDSVRLTLLHTLISFSSFDEHPRSWNSSSNNIDRCDHRGQQRVKGQWCNQQCGAVYQFEQLCRLTTATGRVN